MVGAGVSGLGAAWALSRCHDVTLFEAEARLGGHAHTHTLELPDGPVTVDTGFIVYNEKTYPNFIRFLAALDVPTEASNMSLAVSLAGGRREYDGTVAGLLAQGCNVLRPDHWRMVGELVRFYRSAPRAFQAGLDPALSLEDFLDQEGYSQVFRRDHLLPMAAAIWSSSLDQVLAFPARSFLAFFCNHGLLNLGARPAWRTVTGGSQAYVRKVAQALRERAVTGCPVVSAQRDQNGVHLRFADGNSAVFDQVVFATHADRTLAILGEEASPLERSLLGALRYQTNRALLHSDPELMPRRRRLWSSWNYMAEDQVDQSRQVAVTYWMNRLQNLSTREPLLVTLNPLREPAPEKVIAELAYDHPVFDAGAITAQQRLTAIQGQGRSWYCGAYCGYGFHEDGLQSGFSVAAALGAPVSWQDVVEPASPAAFTPRVEPIRQAAA